MSGLFCLVLPVLTSPFKSKIRLEAEYAVLRRQLIVLRRKVRGRVRRTNNGRWFLIHPDAGAGDGFIHIASSFQKIVSHSDMVTPVTKPN